MTVGQRIAQKRKEQGLSQEGLGEQLGVSRQAIYKWESDASLPEIDKLITLSKIFSVSVGWLLGVEEEAQPQQQEGSGELTETQLQMVQEIVDRYLAARPAPKKSVWDKWPVRILFAMCGIMLALLVGTTRKIKGIEQQYNYIANSIDIVNLSVDSQINSITRRVEDILKSQNNLTAEWSAQVASTDLRANTVTFDVRAVPKTYVEGMTAVFQARSGEDTVDLPVEAGADGAFAGQITCPLTDDISLTAVFVTGDKRETQWLEDYRYLYSGTFPSLILHSWLYSENPDKNGVLSAKGSGEVTVRDMEDTVSHALGFRPEPPATLRVGLFRDRKLLLWYEEQEQDINYNGTPTKKYVWVRTQDVTLEPGHTYSEAVVYTDKYGRQYIYEGHTPIEYNAAKQSASPINSYELSSDPADWEF